VHHSKRFSLFLVIALFRHLTTPPIRFSFSPVRDAVAATTCLNVEFSAKLSGSFSQSSIALKSALSLNASGVPKYDSSDLTSSALISIGTNIATVHKAIENSTIFFIAFSFKLSSPIKLSAKIVWFHVSIK
jgi:hypothetical protein